MEIIKLKIIFLEMKICKRGNCASFIYFLDKRYLELINILYDILYDILILFLLKYLYKY